MYAGATYPEVFIAADDLIKERHKNDPKVITEPKKVKMPFIKGVPGVRGPIIVTEDWYFKKEKKRLAKRALDKREMQIEMMELLTKKDRLRYKASSLDITKKKDAKKLVEINTKIKDINAELELLQDQSGIVISQLDRGTKISRIVGHIKTMIRKKVKAFKKFVKNNEKFIMGMLGIIVPGILTLIISGGGGK